MADLFLTWLPLVLSVASFGICIYLLKLKMNAKGNLNAELSELRAEIASSSQKVNSLKKQFTEFRTASINMGQAVNELSSQSQELSERLNELEMVDTDSKLYSRASKMVQLGADVTELMEECELPKAEAELMMSLKGKLAGKQAISPLNDEEDIAR